MLAARVHAYGGVEQLRIEHAPTPVAGPGQALVRVHAASVNPVDWKMRAGATKARYPLKFPAILGRDFAGVVEAVNADVSAFRPGNEVYGYCGVDQDGAYAEYTALPAAHLARKPSSLTMVEAAAMPTVTLTAHIALYEFAGLRRGHEILIHAGAGGVGSMAVQFARYSGAKVYATGSRATAELIKSLGADVVIDYRSQRFEDFAKNIDIVLDTIGAETRERSWDCLRPGGYLATVAGPPIAAEDPRRHGVRGSWVGARPDGALLTQFAELVDAGRLRPVIDTVLPLAEVREAHRLSETGRAHGKIVLTMA
jgi:NADPH:quinone reductase-like Zn-dependent oxidoreductase